LAFCEGRDSTRLEPLCNKKLYLF